MPGGERRAPLPGTSPGRSPCAGLEREGSWNRGRTRLSRIPFRSVPEARTAAAAQPESCGRASSTTYHDRGFGGTPWLRHGKSIRNQNSRSVDPRTVRRRFAATALLGSVAARTRTSDVPAMSAGDSGQFSWARQRGSGGATCRRPRRGGASHLLDGLRRCAAGSARAHRPARWWPRPCRFGPARGSRDTDGTHRPWRARTYGHRSRPGTTPRSRGARSETGRR